MHALGQIKKEARKKREAVSAANAAAKHGKRIVARHAADVFPLSPTLLTSRTSCPPNHRSPMKVVVHHNFVEIFERGCGAHSAPMHYIKRWATIQCIQRWATPSGPDVGLGWVISWGVVSFVGLTRGCSGRRASFSTSLCGRQAGGSSRGRAAPGRAAPSLACKVRAPPSLHQHSRGPLLSATHAPSV